MPLAREPRQLEMHRRRVRTLSLAIVLLACTLGVGCISCSVKQDPDTLRQKTAQTTAEMKSDAKAIAQGVREGLTAKDPVDLNHGSKEQLAKLPGIDDAAADRIIAARPYESTRQLITRHIVSETEYARIKDHVRTE